jgi:hypothetical protein
MDVPHIQTPSRLCVLWAFLCKKNLFCAFCGTSGKTPSPGIDALMWRAPFQTNPLASSRIHTTMSGIGWNDVLMYVASTFQANPLAGRWLQLQPAPSRARSARALGACTCTMHGRARARTCEQDAVARGALNFFLTDLGVYFFGGTNQPQNIFFLTFFFSEFLGVSQ